MAFLKFACIICMRDYSCYSPSSPPTSPGSPSSLGWLYGPLWGMKISTPSKFSQYMLVQLWRRKAIYTVWSQITTTNALSPIYISTPTKFVIQKQKIWHRKDNIFSTWQILLTSGHQRTKCQQKRRFWYPIVVPASEKKLNDEVVVKVEFRKKKR